MSPLIVSVSGQPLVFTGEGFINTPALGCKFGNVFATSVKYYNRTKIEC